MKKTASFLCMIAIALVAVFGGVTVTAFADEFEDECDVVFTKALEKAVEDEGLTAYGIEARKSLVYDMSGNRLGYLYAMSYDIGEGFALVINTDGLFRVAELYLNAENPFSGKEGQYVYPLLFTYLLWDGENYRQAETGAVLSEESVALLSEKSFQGTYDMNVGTTEFYFTNADENKYKLAFRYPTYYNMNTPQFPNACGAAAGASLVGFWTRYYPDLVPGFTPGSVKLGRYMYDETPDEAQAIIEDLYGYMKIAQNKGVTVNNFVGGLTSFVEAKGQHVNFASTMTGGKFSFAKAKEQLDAGAPLAIFVDGFAVMEVGLDDDSALILYVTSKACHVFAGFGYSEITYTFSDGTTRTDSFIQVASDIFERLKGYYNIHYATQIDQCYAVTVS